MWNSRPLRTVAPAARVCSPGADVSRCYIGLIALSARLGLRANDPLLEGGFGEMRLRFRLAQHLGVLAKAEPAGQAEDWPGGRADLLIAGMGGQGPVVVQLGVLAHADLDRLAGLGRNSRLGSVRRAWGTEMAHLAGDRLLQTTEMLFRRDGVPGCRSLIFCRWEWLQRVPAAASGGTEAHSQEALAGGRGRRRLQSVIDKLLAAARSPADLRGSPVATSLRPCRTRTGDLSAPGVAADPLTCR